MTPVSSTILALVVLSLPVAAQIAAKPSAASTESSQVTASTTLAAAAQVPRLVKFSGTLPEFSSGGTEKSDVPHEYNKPASIQIVGITFSLYATESGGVPLWSEVQNVRVDEAGNYTVELGSTKPDGLPTELFTSAQAQWLGVRPEGQDEQPRIMLLSVPYALKAADAETFGGKPPSAYLSATSSKSSVASMGLRGGPSKDPKGPHPLPISGSGTTNYVALWTSASTLASSVLYQATSRYLGVGTTSPTAVLAVQAGAADSVGIYGNVPATSGTTYGVSGKSASTGGIGVRGEVTASTSSGFAYGVEGIGDGTGAYGVAGFATATSGNGIGTYGRSFSSTGIGVLGESLETSGNTFGVAGNNASPDGVGVVGGATATSGHAYGVSGFSASTTGIGVRGEATASSGSGYGVEGLADSSAGFGVVGINTASSGNGIGVEGVANETSGTAFGVVGITNSSTNNAAGVSGVTNSATGAVHGVSGTTISTTNLAAGVIGTASATSGRVYGVIGSSASTTAASAGVTGFSSAASGQVYGVTGGTSSTSTNAAGVNGTEGASTGQVYGVSGYASSATDFAAGVYGLESATTGKSYGVAGTTNSTSHKAAGVGGLAMASSGSTFGVLGQTNSGDPGAAGVAGYAGGNAAGVYGETASTTSSGVAGVSGVATGATGNANGVYGATNTPTGSGVYGVANGFTTSAGGTFIATGGTGVGAQGAVGISAQGAGIGGQFFASSSPGTAGFFQLQGSSGAILAGNNATQNVFFVDVNGNGFFAGNVAKGGGSFKIDHPLDPANKYLSHSFVESPDMMNIYNGIVRLNARGEAWVELPGYFEALNRDFRYQLTSIGAPQPRLYVAHEVHGNRFKIAGGKANAKVSWQLTGIRQDAWANAHRIRNEEDKPADERGHYLHPELFGAPASQAIHNARVRRPADMGSAADARGGN